MRKTLMAVVAATLFLPAMAFAQLPSIGIKGGLNLANIGGDDAGSPDYKAGLNIGGFVSFSAGGLIGIQPEAYFSQKGAKEGGDALSMNYLEIPVLLKLSPSLPGAFVRPVFFAGPTAGILLSAKEGGTDIKDTFKTADFGLTVGGGVELGKLSVDARYNLGLSQISDLGAISADIKNRAITVLVGLTLF